MSTMPQPAGLVAVTKKELNRLGHGNIFINLAPRGFSYSGGEEGYEIVGVNLVLDERTALEVIDDVIVRVLYDAETAPHWDDYDWHVREVRRQTIEWVKDFSFRV